MAFIIILITVAAMELKAWLMHKYVLHGILWKLHRSHHVPHQHALERNDLFFLYYALLAMACFVYGAREHATFTWIGVGISVYGLVYFLVHDLYIHRRLKIFEKTGNTYLRALDIAHKMHHKSQDQANSESFGFLWVHPKYLKLARRKPQA